MSIPFDGAKVDLTFTAVDFGTVPEVVVQPTKKSVPVGSSHELPPMPSKEEVEAQFVEVAVCSFKKVLSEIMSFVF
jgi:hypothetical protein